MSYGTFGTGTSAHLAGELFKSMAKVNMIAVPYKGAAPAITDVIGGQDPGGLYDGRKRASLIEGGQLRALAVTSAQRSPAFPQLPTVAEAGVPGYAGGSLVRPVRTGQNAARDHRAPQPIGDESRAVRRVQEAERQRRPRDGRRPPGRTRPLLSQREERWRKVIQDAGNQDRVGASPAITFSGIALQHGKPALHTQRSGSHIVSWKKAGAPLASRLERSMWMLLLVPFVGLLWVPFYNFTEPTLFGFPSSIGTSSHGCRSARS